LITLICLAIDNTTTSALPPPSLTRARARTHASFHTALCRPAALSVCMLMLSCCRHLRQLVPLVTILVLSPFFSFDADSCHTCCSVTDAMLITSSQLCDRSSVSGIGDRLLTPVTSSLTGKLKLNRSCYADMSVVVATVTCDRLQATDHCELFVVWGLTLLLDAADNLG
jgi:hypothetical protein